MLKLKLLQLLSTVCILFCFTFKFIGILQINSNDSHYNSFSIDLDGVNEVIICLLLLFIFYFFSNDSFSFKKESSSRISTDLSLPLINVKEKESIFRFNISQHQFKKNYLCLLEGIITISKESQNKRKLNSLFDKKKIISSFKYNCIVDNENNVNITKQLSNSKRTLLFRNTLVLNEHYPEIFHNIRYLNDI